MQHDLQVLQFWSMIVRQSKIDTIFFRKKISYFYVVEGLYWVFTDKRDLFEQK